MMEALELNQNETGHRSSMSADEMEDALGTDREAALADMRYSYIEQIWRRMRSSNPARPASSCGRVQIDRMLTHKVLWPSRSSWCIMLLVFWLTFGVIGAAAAATCLARGHRPGDQPG